MLYSVFLFKADRECNCTPGIFFHISVTVVFGMILLILGPKSTVLLTVTYQSTMYLISNIGLFFQLFKCSISCTLKIPRVKCPRLFSGTCLKREALHKLYCSKALV